MDNQADLKRNPFGEETLLSIGIDLGTTNSAVTVGIPLNGRLQLESVGIDQVADADGNVVRLNYLPSVALLPSTPGQDAEVGLWPYQSGRTEADGRIASIKNRMGSDWSLSHQGKSYTPERIASFFVRRLLHAVQLSGLTAREVESAVITIPASFTEAMKDSTRNAAVLAGLTSARIYLLYEPVAALLNLVYEMESQGASNALVTRGLLNGSNGACRVLVFDIGGGTVDVAVYELQECWEAGKYRLRSVGKGVSPHVLMGGDHFDRALCEMLIRRAEEETGTRFTETGRRQQEGLWLLQCEKVKKELSRLYANRRASRGGVSPSEWDEIVHRPMLNVIGGKRWTPKVSFTDLCEAFAPLLGWDKFPEERMDESDKGAVFATAAHIMEPVWLTLQRAFGRIQAEDIDLVLPVGGMAYLPMIQSRLAEYFGTGRLAPVLTGFDLNLAVSRGAAIHHHQMVQGDSLLQTILPHVQIQVLHDGSPAWRDIIPKKTLVQAGEPFRIVENHVGFPANRSFILLPLRTNEQVRGAARIDWPSSLPAPKKPLPLEIHLVVDAQHTTISGRVSSNGKEIDASFTLDELAKPEMLIEGGQEKEEEKNSAERWKTIIRQKLFPGARSPYCERSGEIVPLIERSMKNFREAKTLVNGVLRTRKHQSAVQDLGAARMILQVCIGFDGPASFLSPVEKAALEAAAPVVWKSAEGVLRAPIRAGDEVNFVNSLLTVAGTLKAMAPAQAVDLFFHLGKESPRVRGEALHALGRCIRKWPEWKRLIEKAPEWADSGPQFFWAVSRSLVRMDLSSSLKEAVSRKTVESLADFASVYMLKYEPLTNRREWSRMAGITVLCLLVFRDLWPDFLAPETPSGRRMIAALELCSPYPIKALEGMDFWGILQGALKGTMSGPAGLIRFLAEVLRD